jgi:hypothetical protein
MNMEQTGGSLFIALSLVVMVLPLIPLCIFFVRKVHLTPVLNTLRIVCLFIFLQHLVTGFMLRNTPVIQPITQLIEFLLAFYMIKWMMTDKPMRDIMNMLMVSFLSVIVTIYTIKGIMSFPKTITAIQGIILFTLAFIVLLQLINNKQMVMIHEPAFWIAGGILCYYGMSVFMEAILTWNSGLSQQINQEKNLVLLATEVIRFAFFTTAAYVAGASRDAELRQI